VQPGRDTRSPIRSRKLEVPLKMTAKQSGTRARRRKDRSTGLSGKQSGETDPSMIATGAARAQPTSAVSREVRQQLAERLGQALADVGIEALVEVATADPTQLPAVGRQLVLGSRGGPCSAAVEIILKPSSPSAATADDWAENRVGEAVVLRVASKTLPAHVGVRLRYAVAGADGRRIATDPPQMGRARFGRTHLPGWPAHARSPECHADALLLELLADLEELFEFSVDPEHELGTFEELLRRHRSRHRRLYQDGELITAAWASDVMNRIDALERLGTEWFRARAVARRRGRLEQQRPIPLNPPSEPRRSTR
jgi:hypothetical protein